MANEGYKVLVDELTVHKAVRPLTHPVTGESTGWQQGAGETWFLDEVVPREAMNPEWADALDSGEGDLYEALAGKLEPTSDEPAINEAYRLGLPFEGYDDMDEDDILAAMRVLPSAAVQRMKDWENQNEGREAIVNFNIGFGEAPDDRQTGRIGQVEDEETDDNKPVREMRTRELDGESGEFQYGEGITGSGDPPVAPGTEAKKESKKGNGDTRSGRRPRPGGASKKPPATESSGGPVAATTTKKPPASPSQGSTTS